MKRHILISVGAHVMLLLVASIVLLRVPAVNLIGEKNVTVIRSYFKQAVQQSRAEKKQEEATKSTIARQPKKITIQKSTLANSVSKGDNASTLLSLLHAAIQQQQHYPLSAQQMERQGRVTVAFRLFADGKISQLHVAHSSGTDSLDQAALSAVQAAAPFNEVNKYLQDAQEFKVDVLFEL